MTLDRNGFDRHKDAGFKAAFYRQLNALMAELDWQELPDAHACRIATWRQDSPIDDEAQWGAYLDWFVQRIVKMNAVFRPVIQALG